MEALNNYNPIKVCSVVIITSDKSYKNIELKRGYREDDVLGGYDPYSASKACAELIIQSYLKTFLGKKNIKISVARAGNVIGGEIGLKIELYLIVWDQFQKEESNYKIS